MSNDTAAIIVVVVYIIGMSAFLFIFARWQERKEESREGMPEGYSALVEAEQTLEQYQRCLDQGR